MTSQSDFVIFDLEYMTGEGWRDHGWGHNGMHRELLQIAATRVSPGMPFNAERTLNVLVWPYFNPLNDFTTKLTGITQERLEQEGMQLEKALEVFADFIGDLPCFSNGMDINVIAETCGLRKVIMPLLPLQFGSLRKPMYDALHQLVEDKDFKHEDYPSGNLHQLVDIELLKGMGQVHDALRDVWSLQVTNQWLLDRNVDVISPLVLELVKRMAYVKYGKL